MIMKRIFGIVAVVFVMALAVVSANAQADPQNRSDVVGSDGFLGISGHVGLYDGHSKKGKPDGKILEVYWNLGKNNGINNTCVHYERTLDKFKGIGNSYWGARYDKSLSPNQLKGVFDILKKQGDSYKATYNLTMPLLRFRITSARAWVVNMNNGGLVEKKVTGDAILRCDFAVAAAYKEKAKKDLFGLVLMPLTVFWNMPNKR